MQLIYYICNIKLIIKAGFNFWSQGEIVDFSQNWSKKPSTKVFHETVINSKGEVIKLYYLVGETDYNAPKDSWLNPKNKQHEIFE